MVHRQMGTWRSCGLLWLGCVVLVCAFPRVAAEDEVPKVQEPAALDTARPARLDLVLSPDLRRLTGTFEYPVTNHTDHPLNQLLLVLHPRRFRNPPSALNDINYRWIYPGPWEAGDMKLLELTTASLSDPALELGSAHRTGPSRRGRRFLPAEPPRPVPGTPEAVLLDVFPDSQGTLALVMLHAPLGPEETLLVRGRFETSIPQRFGTFGRYLNQVALDAPVPLICGQTPGGFDPGVTLPSYRFELRLEVPPGLERFVGGEPYLGPRTWEGSVPSLRIGAGLETEFLRWDGLPPLAVTWLPLVGPVRRARFERVARQSLERLRALAPGLFVEPLPSLSWQQVTMRDALVAPVGRSVWFSDHLFRVSPLFVALHDQEVRFRLFQQLLETRLEPREGSDARWLSEGLAYWLAGTLQTDEERRVDIETRLEAFTVIPIVDRLLHNPRYPFGETYARARYRPDRFRQTLESTVNPMFHGAVVLDRIETRLGKDAFSALVSDYLQGGSEGPGFRELVAAQGDGALSLLEAWLQPVRETNYRVADWKSTWTDGVYRTTVRLDREPGLPPERVEVQLRTQPRLHVPDGRALPRLESEEQIQIWDASGPDGSVTFESLRRPSGITLDPQRHLIESNRADNDDPVRYNWLIWDFLVSSNAAAVQAQEGSAEAEGVEPDRFLSVLANLRYKDTLLERHVWDIEGFRLEESFGGAFGYYHYFGRQRTVYRWEHELSARLEYRNLRQDFQVEGADPPGSHLADIDSALTLKGGYSFENRMNPYTPIHGGAIDLKFQLGTGLDERIATIGVASSFASLSLHARRLFPFSAVHGIAARARVDSFLWGVAVPRMNGFLLGGYGELRSLKPRAAVGESRLLLSIEERHPLLLDLDIDLLLWRARELRGVAFLDVGTVGGRFFSGMAARPLSAGIGYGIRVNMDLFGLSPLLLAVDLAVPLDGLLAGEGIPAPLEILEQSRLLVGSYHSF